MVLMGLSFMFYVLSNYTPTWGVTADKVKVTFGLWKVCFDGSLINSKKMECAAIDCSKESKAKQNCFKVIIARIMVTAACILTSIAAILLTALVEKKEGFNKILLIVVKVTIIMGFLVGLIGLSLGINGLISNSAGSIKLGSAAMIAIVAVILNLFGGIASFFIRSEE